MSKTAAEVLGFEFWSNLIHCAAERCAKKGNLDIFYLFFLLKCNAMQIGGGV